MAYSSTTLDSETQRLPEAGRVAGMVERSGLYENATAAAWLHDVVEDQPVTVADVANEFGAEVAMIVLDLTDTPAGKGLNREERKAMDAYRLSRASGDAQSIKCADLISNTSSIVQHDPGFARMTWRYPKCYEACRRAEAKSDCPFPEPPN